MTPGDSSATPLVDRRSSAVAGSSAEGIELSHVGRYVLVALLVSGCMMLSAWSRIDLRGTAVALDQAERSWQSARADQARLELELASLRSPATLRGQAATLQLSDDVTVVTLPDVPPSR